MFIYQRSNTIAACLLDIISMLVYHYQLITVHYSSNLATTIYKTYHVVLIYPPSCIRLSEAQIPLLPMDIATCAKFIMERIAIMGAKNLVYSSAHNTPLFNYARQFWDSLCQFNCFPTLKNTATHKNFLFVI